MFLFTKLKDRYNKRIDEKSTKPPSRLKKFASAALLAAGIITLSLIPSCQEDRSVKQSNGNKDADSAVSDIVSDASVQSDAGSDVFVLPDAKKDGKDIAVDGKGTDTISDVEKADVGSDTKEADAVFDAILDVLVQSDVQKDTLFVWDSGTKEFSCVIDPQVIASEGGVDLNPSAIEVHDGDSGTGPDEKYRFSACDAAELAVDCIGGKTWSDQYGTGEFSDVNYGQLGKEYAVNAFLAAKSAKVVKGKLDENNRRLSYFLISTGNGYDLLNCLLVREGLAWETVSYYGLGSHPPLAQKVLDASKFAGEPHFANPYLYKKNAQSCQ